MQKPYQNYKPVDFLKDERFIKWQLFPDEEDHLYWNSFIKKYPEQNEDYPESIRKSKDLQAIYDNTDGNEILAIKLHNAVLSSKMSGFRGDPIKENRIKKTGKQN